MPGYSLVACVWTCHPNSACSLLTCGTSLCVCVCGQTEPQWSKVLAMGLLWALLRLSAAPLWATERSGLQPVWIWWRKKSEVCWDRKRERWIRGRRERETRRRRGQKEKSESCSCACGRIATSSVLADINTNKIEIFLKAVWHVGRNIKAEDLGRRSQVDGRDVMDHESSF